MPARAWAENKAWADLLAARARRKPLADCSANDHRPACSPAAPSASGGTAVVDELALETLSRDVQANRRIEIAQELTKAGLLRPAVTVWSDVVRHHGEAIDQGLLTASHLVRSGRREDVLAVLDEALADEQLPAPTRGRLRALRAWAPA